MSSENYPLFPHAPSLHTGHVALSLGFGAEFGWEMAMLTLWSFHKAVVETAVIPTSLVVLTNTPQLLQKHQAAVPSLRVQTFNMSVLRSLEHINRPLEPADGGWFRFPLQATYVQRYCQQAQLVLLFDLKDILFQSSPFELAPRSPNGEPQDTLTSFTEMWKLRRGSWNHQKMAPFKHIYPTLIDRILEAKLTGLNNGLLMGPPNRVAHYVRELSSGVLGLTPRPAVMEGLDQGLHNLLVYRQKFADEDQPSRAVAPAHTVIEMNLNATCPVLTMHMLNPDIYTCDHVDRERPGTSVFRFRSVASGEAFTLVHQWNRASECVQRAVLCHHRHLFHLPRVRCGPTTSCHPCRPERAFVQQEEREVLQKVRASHLNSVAIKLTTSLIFGGDHSR